MSKYIIAVVAFVTSWIAGYTVYVAINGFNLVYGGDTAALVAFFWVVSLVAGFCGYAAVRNEEER
ncbi:hypothetical protein SRABI106_01633 [Rahnella aquatilis]|nr:hypothetical protein SRABI106_01633 [Rahnella aquatilis]